MMVTFMWYLLLKLKMLSLPRDHISSKAPINSEKGGPEFRYNLVGTKCIVIQMSNCTVVYYPYQTR